MTDTKNKMRDIFNRTRATHRYRFEDLERNAHEGKQASIRNYLKLERQAKKELKNEN